MFRLAIAPIFLGTGILRRLALRARTNRAVLRARWKVLTEGPVEHCIIRNVEGVINSTARSAAAILVHYDPAGRVRPELLSYVQDLNANSFAVFFVSAADSLADSTIARLTPHCAQVLHRRNIGYDFGSYRDGLRAAGNLERFDRVLIANDSVHGPFTSLAPLFARCNSDADVWGMTDSPERPRHLQSYFMLFRAPALRHPLFMRFWDDYPCPNNKLAVVQLGELALGKHLIRLGLRQAALFPYETVRAAFLKRAKAGGIEPLPPRRGNPLGDRELLHLTLRNSPLNPTHFYWRELIAAGCPMLKRELTDRNPMGLHGVDDWRAVVQAHQLHWSGAESS
jgi:hypothetical protein